MSYLVTHEQYAPAEPTELSKAVAEFRSAREDFAATAKKYLGAPVHNSYQETLPLERQHTDALDRLNKARQGVLDAALQEFP